jgi:hypothetical protein
MVVMVVMVSWLRNLSQPLGIYAEGAMPKSSRRKSKKDKWVIGEDLTIQIKDLFRQVCILIDRKGGGLLVITPDEADRLAALLPEIATEARKNADVTPQDQPGKE